MAFIVFSAPAIACCMSASSAAIASVLTAFRLISIYHPGSKEGRGATVSRLGAACPGSGRLKYERRVQRRSHAGPTERPDFGVVPSARRSFRSLGGVRTRMTHRRIASGALATFLALGTRASAGAEQPGTLVVPEALSQQQVAAIDKIAATAIDRKATPSVAIGVAK